jgi:hypothetical protein
VTIPTEYPEYPACRAVSSWRSNRCSGAPSVAQFDVLSEVKKWGDIVRRLVLKIEKQIPNRDLPALIPRPEDGSLLNQSPLRQPASSWHRGGKVHPVPD